MTTSAASVSTIATSSSVPVINAQSGNKSEKENPNWTIKSIYFYLRRSRSSDEFNIKIGTILGDILGYTWVTVLFSILGIMPFALMIIGAANWNNCQIKIPLYMVVAGSVGLLKLFLTLIYRYIRSKTTSTSPAYEYAQPSTIDGLISVFLIGWTFIGSAWVFGADVQFTDVKEKATYCNHITYWSAFIYSILTLILLLIIFIFFVGYVVRACILCNQNENVTIVIVEEVEVVEENKLMRFLKRIRPKKDLPAPAMPMSDISTTKPAPTAVPVEEEMCAEDPV